MAFHIADLFEYSADLVGERIALVQGDRSLSYAELDARATRLAHALQEQGVTPHDRVALYSRNTIEAIESMLAIYKLRAIMVNINYRYVADEVRHILTDSAASAVIVEERYVPTLTAALGEDSACHTIVVVSDGASGEGTSGAVSASLGDAVSAVDYESIIAGASDTRDFGERAGDDIYILYTGGTTGAPKGVMWRHEDVIMVLGGGINPLSGEKVTSERQLAEQGAAMDPIIAHALPPLIHGGAQWAILQALFQGRTSVVEPEFDPVQVWNNVARHKINLLFITGDAMARPLIDSWDPDTFDASSLMYVGSSAAMLSRSVREQWLEAFPNLFLTDNIGASETGFSGIEQVTKDHPMSSGPRVRIDAETTVLDATGTPVVPGSGVVGKIARSGHIPLGYWRDEEKTAATFKTYDGVRYSIPGDDATVEADGTVTMLGRGSVSINTGGEKVHPEEVESALKAHPEVFDVFVVGVPDERMGNKVAAVASLRGERVPSLTEINDTARRFIAGYKCPRAVWFVDQLKRSPAGKPDYRWAKQITEQRPADATQEFSQ